MTRRDPEPPIDHEAALQAASLKHASNLARAYLDMRAQRDALSEKLTQLKIELQTFTRLRETLQREAKPLVDNPAQQFPPFTDD